MKFTHHSTLITPLLTIVATVGMGTAAQAFSLYFGEDLGKGETVRLATTPNADAARNRFLSNLVGVGTETFDSYANQTKAPLSINFGSAGTATLQGNGYINQVPKGTNGAGRYPTSGKNYWEASDQFGISFSKPVAAFGFYGVDIGDFEGQLKLTLLNTLTNFQQTVTVPHTMKGEGGGVLYFGLIAAPNELFNQIIFGNTAQGVDYFAFDDMTIGSLEQVHSEPVPEPLTMTGLMLGGSLLAGGRRWRKRRQSITAEKP